MKVLVLILLIICNFHSIPIHCSERKRSNLNRNSIRFNQTVSWKQYENVNGLWNRDVVMVVTTTVHFGGRYLRERILPSLRTWMRLFMNVFIIIEDTADTRFYFRHCQLIDYETSSTFQCPHENVVYVMTRQCTEDYFHSSGICCKFDESLNFLKINRKHLFSHMKYLIHSDDDTYFRVDEVLRWLSLVEKANISHLPIIGNGVITKPENDRDSGIFNINGCKEVFTNGWYQPLFLNHHAADILSYRTQYRAATQTCTAFKISQDIALGILAWLLEFYHIYVPNVYTNPSQRGFVALKPDRMVIHGVRHIQQDDCLGNSWPDSMKYNQQAMVGCGRINQVSPAHNILNSINMYDVWNYFHVNGTKVPIGIIDEDNNEWINNNGILSPKLLKLSGYNTTKHYQLHRNYKSEWKQFTLEDCAIRGEINT